MTPSGSQRRVNSDVITIEDCLADVKKSSVLDEENQWYCNKCKDHVQAEKTMSLYRLPRYLVLTLKRFKASRVS